MFTLKDLLALTDGDGATLKDYESIKYRTGWQVATEGMETPDPIVAYAYIKQYNGNCGVWLENGIYYIDKSYRETTKAQALKVGKAHNQISIYGWAKGNLAYC